MRENQDYIDAYDERVLAHHDLHNAVGALNSARNQIKSHEEYHKQSMDQQRGSPYTPLTPAKKAEIEKEISEWIPTVADEYSKFAAAHEEMRDIEKRNKIKPAHRLARTNMFGKMYGKHGIHNINASHLSESDKMEDVLPWGRAYQGGRRKKTRKKRRRKNKRKTKRRKKTRRRKKRRKKRRTILIL